MHTVAAAAAASFAALFPIVDPIGAAPTFAALTAGHSLQARRSEALRSAAAMAAILLVFLVAGAPLLHFFGISLEALQIAAGIIIAAYGFQMVTSRDITGSRASPGEHVASIAFSPMAMPLLAGPGALGIVMGLRARDSGPLVLPGFVIGIVVLAVLVYACLRFADNLRLVLGTSGLECLIRVMGLLVLAIGVEFVVHGIATHEAIRSLH